MNILPGAAFLAVDVQNGFISEPDELPVAGGTEVIPLLNALLPLFDIRIASQDWHPAGHGSFAASHPGRRPFDTGELDGIPQVFWPIHCVQGTRGAELHPGFDARPLHAIFRKGTDPRVDSYSVFADNAGRNPSGLDGYLRARGATALWLGGLALDYCVLYTSRDARRLMPEIPVVVVLEATRPVDPAGGEAAVREMERLGVTVLRGPVIRGDRRG
ncbi:MAG TPA: nicotinamidase [Candidatus Polarisedimenticolia bacterium]|nr:nicotinamidase [Candidatus Polarisedimenticolia bacterium]